MSETTAQPNDRDERGGLPSASGMYRVRHCPGSVRAEASVPKGIDGSADADEGTARHSLIEIGADSDSIDDSNTAYTVEQARRNELEAIRRIGYEGLEPTLTLREKRLWVYDSDLRPRTSARLDLAFIWADVGLIVDHKTLFGDHGHAKDNEQLLTQVVALVQEHGLSTVYVALSQPNIEKERRLTMAEYSANDIMVGYTRVIGWLDSAASPDAKRVQGWWCEHCKARAHCPEGREMSLAAPVQNAPVGITSDAIAATLTNETLANFLVRATAAESIIASCRDELKRRIQEDADAFKALGWGLKPGGTMRKVTKPEVAFGLLSQAGATQEEFMGTITVAIGKLEKLYQSKVDGKKAVVAEQLEAALKAAGALEETTKAASLIRIK